MPNKRGFTIIELLVVMSVLMLLIAILVPSLAETRERARYAKWAGYSHTLRTDRDLDLYYNFEQQDATQFNGAGFAIAWNRAGGNVMQQARSNTDPSQWYLQLGCTTGAGCTNANTAPKWINADTRFSGKGGLLFDGTDDRAPINYVIQARTLPNVTVATWVWTSNDASAQTLVSYDRTKVFELNVKDVTPANQIGWWTRGSTSAGVTLNPSSTATTYADGVWHLVVGVYNNNNNTNNPNFAANNPRKRVFVDGVMVSSAADPHTQELLGSAGAWGYVGVASTATTFSGTVGGGFLKGAIDEVAVFHRRVADREIEEMYAVGKPRERR